MDQDKNPMPAPVEHQICPAVCVLMKLSFDEEHRHAMNELGRKATRGISSQELGQGLSGEEQDGASGGVTVGDRATGDYFLLIPSL